MGQLAVAAFVITALAVELARRPMVIMYALLAVHAWGLLASLPSVRVAGVGVGPADVVNVIALGVALIRVRRGLNVWQWALLGAITLVVVGALRGYLLLGDAALLGFRAELYFLVPALFVTTLAPWHVPAVINATIRFGGLIAVLAIVRWLLLSLGVPLAAVPTEPGFAVSRVIGWGAALGVAFAAVAMVQRALASTWEYRRSAVTGMSAGMLLLVVLLAQHRSVWVATMVMVALAFLRARGRVALRTAVMVLAAIGVLTVEIAGIGDSGAVVESLTHAASSTITWEWRLGRWEAVWLTHAARGWEAVAVGSGYGYGWASGVVGAWEVSPHNGFLQIAVRIGLVGALLVFTPFAAMLKRLPRLDDTSAVLLWLWLIGTIVFFVPYSGSPLTGVVLGAAVLHGRIGPRGRVAESPRVPVAGRLGRFTL